MSTTWASGSNGKVALIREDTFGVTPTTLDSTNIYVVPFNTCDLTMNQAPQTPATITGNRSASRPFRGNKDVTGNIVVPVDSRAIGLWLKLLFGSPSTTGSGPYVHVFTIPTTMPSYTIEKGFTDISDYYKYTGCKASNFSLTYGGDGELTTTIGLQGANEVYSATSMIADTIFETDWSAMSNRLYNNMGTVSIGGETMCTTEFSVNVDNVLENAYCINDQGAKNECVGGQTVVTGSFTGIFANDTFLAIGRADTEMALTLSITDGIYTFLLTFDEVVLSTSSPGITGPTGIYQTLDFTAFYNNGASVSSIKATLTNGVALYDDTTV